MAREGWLAVALLAHETGAPAGPTFDELAGVPAAAGESAYMPAKRCRFGDIDTHDKLLGLLKREKIRSRRKGQRLLVHAGDWERYVAEREARAQNLMDDPAVAELLDQAAERMGAGL